MAFPAKSACRDMTSDSMKRSSQSSRARAGRKYSPDAVSKEWEEIMRDHQTYSPLTRIQRCEGNDVLDNDEGERHG